MEKMICNPLNLDYRYQIKKSSFGNSVFREAADPTVVLFKETYFLFASKSGGFWYSEDLGKKDMHKEEMHYRLIMDKPQKTAFLLETSVDGVHWETIKDSRNDNTDYPHDFIDFITLEKSVLSRYIKKVSYITVPFGGVPAISGLRVFGKGSGEKPDKIETVNVKWQSALDIALSWTPARRKRGKNRKNKTGLPIKNALMNKRTGGRNNGCGIYRQSGR